MAFVKRIADAAALGVAILIGSGLSSPLAQAAAYTVTLAQVGSNVVATGSGTIDLTGLSLFESGVSTTIGIAPFEGIIVTAAASGGAFNGYAGFTGPTSFGSGGETLINSGSGDIVGIGGDIDTLAVPAGYTSGNPLSNTSTYDNATFASLGVTPGTYEWMWGLGTNQNFTLIIGGTSVPEPSAIALLGTGLAGFFLVRFRASRRDRRARAGLADSGAPA
jgi:hypothetical protein